MSNYPIYKMYDYEICQNTESPIRKLIASNTKVGCLIEINIFIIKVIKKNYFGLYLTFALPYNGWMFTPP
jgi:hypothetical protein